MITSITVDGFKTLSRFTLTLNPGLNVLVGPNGSGKTNILSFFELLAHLLDTSPAEATSHLGGVGAIFRRIGDTYESIISASINGCYPLDQPQKLPFAFAVTPAYKAMFAFYQYNFSLFFSTDLDSVVFAKQSFRYKHCKAFVTPSEIAKEANNWLLEIDSAHEKATTKTSLKATPDGLKYFLPMFQVTGKATHAAATANAEQFINTMITTSTSIPTVMMRFNPALHLLAEDMAGGQTFNIVPSKVKLPEDTAKPPGIASDGSGLSVTLHSLKRAAGSLGPPGIWVFWSPVRRQSMKTATLDHLLAYFKQANPAIDDLEVTNDSFNNQVRVSFKVKNGKYTANVPLALMSDGTLKWVTLLTAALTASSVFAIEEPENYLHPKMQGQCVNMMREILFSENKYVCTLMTTHSETLLNHCRPSEIIIVAFREGATVAYRVPNEEDVSDEIERTGFGLGYYYISNALDHQ